VIGEGGFEGENEAEIDDELRSQESIGIRTE